MNPERYFKIVELAFNRDVDHKDLRRGRWVEKGQIKVEVFFERVLWWCEDRKKRKSLVLWEVEYRHPNSRGRFCPLPVLLAKLP
jgi:hypothetical protein